MAKKPKLQFRCKECNHTVSKWMGKCTQCQAWNSFDEVVPAPTPHQRTGNIRQVAPIPITQVPMHEGEVRLRVGINELDRVLGGGLVTGSLTLIGGDPGVGKSTLLLMVLSQFSKRSLPTLYISGEESARQIRLRAERLELEGEGLHLLAETDLDVALAAAEKMRPRALVLDSIQTLFSPVVGSVPGSVSQVREVAARTMNMAKKLEIPTFLVGHVTKQGGLAGPKVLEHLVDTVIYFEGDGRSQMRILRATKNRFGSTGEIGFFEMNDRGLEEVPDASARLLAERVAGAAGTAVVPSMEGSRPILAEVQALVGHPSPGNPGRTVLGLDRGRLQMLIAVLGKLGHSAYDRDVFASATGGLRVVEPGGDMAVACAIVSSILNTPIDPHTVLFGEVGLVGEIRAIGHPAQRLAEAERHGFRRAIVPKNACRHAPPGMEVIGVQTLHEAICCALRSAKPTAKKTTPRAPHNKPNSAAATSETHPSRDLPSDPDAEYGTIPF